MSKKSDRAADAVLSGKFNARQAQTVCRASSNFAGESQTGSHWQAKSKNGNRTTVPMHGNQDFPKGTAASIKRQMILCGFLVLVIAAFVLLVF